jgi:transcriptional regulator with XRE-family HTH domain
MISRKLKEVVKLSDLRAYEIAHRAEMHPSTLSRILNGIEDVKPGDLRVLRIAKVIGLTPEECFEEIDKSSFSERGSEG